MPPIQIRADGDEFLQPEPERELSNVKAAPTP
jgi:hypothetical protein